MVNAVRIFFVSIRWFTRAFLFGSYAAILSVSCIRIAFLSSCAAALQQQKTHTIAASSLFFRYFKTENVVIKRATNV